MVGLLWEAFGDKLAFHGTICIQKTLPFGTVDDVKNEVKTRIRTVGQGGGLILSPTHSIPGDIPVRNIVTVYETARKYGIYPKYSQ